MWNSLFTTSSLPLPPCFLSDSRQTCQTQKKACKTTKKNAIAVRRARLTGLFQPAMSVWVVLIPPIPRIGIKESQVSRKFSTSWHRQMFFLGGWVKQHFLIEQFVTYMHSQSGCVTSNVFYHPLWRWNWIRSVHNLQHELPLQAHCANLRSLLQCTDGLKLGSS